jgi:hypothetical protein
MEADSARSETVIADASHLLPPGRRCRYCGRLDPDTHEMCIEAPASVLYHADIHPSEGRST